MNNERSVGGPAVEHRQVDPSAPVLEIHRSWRRQRSATVDFRNGRLIARLPAGMSPDAEERVLNDLIPKALNRNQARRRASDAELFQRACRLADDLLDGRQPATVSWSARMGRRWGSCTPATRTIRISNAMAGMPDYVVDYLLVHELVHLQVSRHNATFERLVDRYPQRDRAQAYLDGFLHGQRDAAITHALACGVGANEGPDGGGNNRPTGATGGLTDPAADGAYELPVGPSEPVSSASSSPASALGSCGVAAAGPPSVD